MWKVLWWFVNYEKGFPSPVWMVVNFMMKWEKSKKPFLWTQNEDITFSLLKSILYSHLLLYWGMHTDYGYRKLMWMVFFFQWQHHTNILSMYCWAGQNLHNILYQKWTKNQTSGICLACWFLNMHRWPILKLPESKWNELLPQLHWGSKISATRISFLSQKLTFARC